MGIVHFAGLGRSPGAVTAGLSYILHERRELEGTLGDLVEAVVVFTSPEVREGKERVRTSVLNRYMTKTKVREWQDTHITDVIVEFFKREVGKGALYCYQVDVNDFSACFETIARATLYFGRPSRVGKNIWVNITGGTNVMNAATMQTSFLSGLIAKMYYTFIRDQGNRLYLQPFSRDTNEFRWAEIFMPKTTFDHAYYQVLRTVAAQGDWIKDEELLSRLKRHHPADFGEVTVQNFRREFLNRLDGRGLERWEEGGQKGTRVRLAPEGTQLLEVLDRPLFRLLTRRGGMREKEISHLIAVLEPERLW